MSPEHREYAELLLQKAREDLSASRALAATEGQTESIIGFHLQQAVEKALKSILAAAEIEIPHTHDIEQVLRVVIGAGVELPGGLVSAEWLTPWGVVFRYDDPHQELDIDAGVAAATDAIRLAERALDEDDADLGA